MRPTAAVHSKKSGIIWYDHILTFYTAVIESALRYVIITWFWSFAVKDKFRLNRVVKTVSRIIDRDLP